MSKSQTAIEATIEKLERLGTHVVDYPERMVDTIQMRCGCGNVHTSSLNLKMRQVKKIEETGEGKLSCSECFVRGPKKTDRTDADIRQELFDHHSIIMGDRTGNTKAIHDFTCLTCNHEWSTSIVSVFQSRAKYGTTGCPGCATNDSDARKSAIRSAALERILEEYEILTPDYDGRPGVMIDVKHRECGTEFHVASSRLIYPRPGQIPCPTCSTVSLSW